MAVLVTAIHVLLPRPLTAKEDVDGWNKSGHDAKR